MAGKMPSKPMTIGRAQGVTAAERGPNPDDLTQGRMKVPGPARFMGTVSASKGPIQPGDQQTPKTFYLPEKPISTKAGDASKKS